MSHEHNYASELIWTGAKDGPTKNYRSYSREYVIKMPGKADITASADPTFRGDDKLHNPEDMLVASLSACHMLSYLALCAGNKISVIAYEDASTGKMEMIDDVIRFSEVSLFPNVTISEDSDIEKAMKLHKKAHSICFIANSVNFPVKNTPTIIVEG